MVKWGVSHMAKYEEAKLEIVAFETEDVITASDYEEIRDKD